MNASSFEFVLQTSTLKDRVMSTLRSAATGGFEIEEARCFAPSYEITEITPSILITTLLRPLARVTATAVLQLSISQSTFTIPGSFFCLSRWFRCGNKNQGHVDAKLMTVRIEPSCVKGCPQQTKAALSTSKRSVTRISVNSAIPPTEGNSSSRQSIEHNQAAQKNNGKSAQLVGTWILYVRGSEKSNIHSRVTRIVSLYTKRGDDFPAFLLHH